MTLGRAKEDQLEAILILGKRYYTVRCIDVARFLSITNATVSATIKDLVKNGFVFKSPDNALSLTKKGRELAMQVYERHCFFRQWLIDAGVEEQTAEQEACALEHAISPESFALIQNALKSQTP